MSATARPHAAVWFEIAVAELDRAIGFYETVLQTTLKREPMGPMTLAIFPAGETAVAGCLLAGPNVAPSMQGTTVYLNVDGRLDAVLERVVAAGGSVVIPRTDLPPGMGSFAQVLDSEGNRVGLHTL